MRALSRFDSIGNKQGCWDSMCTLGMVAPLQVSLYVCAVCECVHCVDVFKAKRSKAGSENAFVPTAHHSFTRIVATFNRTGGDILLFTGQMHIPRAA